MWYISVFQDFLPGEWAKVVKHAHIELTNADSTFSVWVSALLSLISPWTISERKHSLALATSQKVSIEQLKINGPTYIDSDSDLGSE